MKPHLSPPNSSSAKESPRNHLRFHLPHLHIFSVFGDDWFALKAEGFNGTL
ncbi:MAG: hypothetical protein OQK50_07870 [Deltaproteobacteria bacterium]|jgi:hypothetical protein|nr:hypothetical protein [Deltaproteobacteria bacterium]MCW8892166.1 hypothetical protein [Deltaproteobacteria bacterium]MCW9050231.1 hypothetical protein [Deltaproteobacteria bacterium]